MANEIVIVIGFIFTIAAMCKVWNLYAMKQYSESKEKKRFFRILQWCSQKTRGAFRK